MPLAARKDRARARPDRLGGGGIRACDGVAGGAAAGLVARGAEGETGFMGGVRRFVRDRLGPGSVALSVVLVLIDALRG